MPTWTYNGASVFTSAPSDDLAIYITEAELDARVGVDEDDDPFIDPDS